MIMENEPQFLGALDFVECILYIVLGFTLEKSHYSVWGFLLEKILGENRDVID